jgi:hypothetical protein
LADEKAGVALDMGLEEVPVLGRSWVGAPVRAEDLVALGIQHAHEYRLSDSFHAAAQPLVAEFGTNASSFGEIRLSQAIAPTDQGKVDVLHDATRVQRQRGRQVLRVTAQTVDRSVSSVLQQQRNDHANGDDERHAERVVQAPSLRAADGLRFDVMEPCHWSKTE